MSRSKHTDPRHIRANRRLLAPCQPRAEGDLGLRRKPGKMIGVSNAVEGKARGFGKTGKSSPRIIWQSPRPGFYHPVSKREILRLLGLVGPIAIYGLRSVELVRAPNPASPLIFGRYEAPGKIKLFEQLAS